MKITYLISLFAFCGILSTSAASTKVDRRYMDASLPPEERTEILLKQMTTNEKVAQIRHLRSGEMFDGQDMNLSRLRQVSGDVSYGFVDGFPLTGENLKNNMLQVQDFMVNSTRLGIPAFIVAEALHGSVHEGSTIFPQNIALASTFNPSLAYKRAAVISDDLHYQGVSQILAPCIDVVRDMRWGRVEETFGEDPYLSGEFAYNEVKGYLDSGISPMLKHFGPHGNPYGGLNLAGVQGSMADFHDVYMKPFERVVRSLPVMAVMSTYNSWNREPNSSSHYLLTDILRDKWGFKGYVYSDWGAISMLHDFHHVAATPAEAAKLAIEAGLDVEASSDCYTYIPQLIADSVMDPAVLDQAVRRVLLAKFTSGLFEDPYGKKYGVKAMHSPESVKLSKQISDESIVLLKNENSLLPLDEKKLKSIAVIGPNADQVQFGGYSYTRDNSFGITPLQGIKNLLGKKVKVNYARGCDIMKLDTADIAEAVDAARKSDVAIIFVGSSSASLSRDYSKANCGEGFDTPDLNLTGAQPELIRRVASTGKPVVLVVATGKAYALNWEKENIPAIVFQWYGGEQEGAAIADMLFGRTVPSGHLPVSIARSSGHLPAHYSHLPTDRGFYHKRGEYGNPGRDYVFSTPDPLWSFGHGLSYTKFKLSDLQATATPEDIQVTLRVTNTGDRTGKAVPQIYIRDVISSMPTPVKLLKAFSKHELKPGETTELHYVIPADELAFTDNNGQKRLENGEFEIMAGLSSENIKLSKKVWYGEKPASNTLSYTNTTGDAYKGTGTVISIQGVVRDVQSAPMGKVKIYSTKQKKVLGTTNQDGTYKVAAADDDILEFGHGTNSASQIPVQGRRKLNVNI